MLFCCEVSFLLWHSFLVQLCCRAVRVCSFLLVVYGVLCRAVLQRADIMLGCLVVAGLACPSLVQQDLVVVLVVFPLCPCYFAW